MFQKRPTWPATEIERWLLWGPLHRSVLRSYGFMIGFSWEKAYAEASHLLRLGISFSLGFVFV